MTRFEIQKIKEGNSPNAFLMFLMFLVFLPVLIIIALIVLPLDFAKKLFNKPEDNSYSDFLWIPWIKSHNRQIHRKLVREEFGHGSHIAYFELKTSDLRLNSMLESRLFSEFHSDFPFGLYLQEIKPFLLFSISYLVFVDFDSGTVTRLYTSRFNNFQWKLKFNKDTQLGIIITEGIDYATILEVSSSKADVVQDRQNITGNQI